MTAFTLMETLSRVITSCEGTSMVIVRVSTRTMRSTTGMRMMRPGPFVGMILPRRKMTARSYSLRIRMDAARNMMTRTTTTMIGYNINTPFCLRFFFHFYFQPIDSNHFHGTPFPDGRLAGCVPVFAPDDDLASTEYLRRSFPHRTDHALPAGEDLAHLGPHGNRDDGNEEQRDDRHRRDKHAPGNPEGRVGRLE